MASINAVVLIGNLTKDPELRSTKGGYSVCTLRLAVNGKEKQGDQWVDRPDYFDVTVWGTQGENCEKYLSKGKPVAVSGRLRFEEWEKEGNKRSRVSIVANTVQFLPSKKQEGGGGGGSEYAEEEPDFQPSTSGGDDDIPF